MSNPPPWVTRPATAAREGIVDVASVIASGVVSAGDVNSQPATGGRIMPPANWSYIWFGVATLYLVGVYTGHLVLANAR